MDITRDYYAVLGVDPTATAAELRAAWKRLVALNHPDRWARYGPESAREATRRTQAINEAWQLLGDAGLRHEYDKLRTLRLLEMVGWRPPGAGPRAIEADTFASHGVSPRSSAPQSPSPRVRRWARRTEPGRHRATQRRVGRKRALRGRLRLARRRDGVPEMVIGPPRATPWGARTVLGISALAVVVALITILIAGLILVGLKGDDPSDAESITGGLIATMALDAAIVGLTYRLVLRKRGLGLAGFGFRGFGAREARYALGGLVAAWVILTVYAVLVEVIGIDRLLPEPSLTDDTFDNVITVIVAAAATVIGAPLAEEAFFRGFLFAGLVPRFGMWPAAIISGALFSSAHFDIGSFIPFTLVGIVLAWLYYRTNTLWTAVAMHFIFNAVSITVAIATENA